MVCPPVRSPRPQLRPPRPPRLLTAVELEGDVRTTGSREGVCGRCDRRLQARQGGLTGALVSRLRSKNPSQNRNKKVLPLFSTVPSFLLPFLPLLRGVNIQSASIPLNRAREEKHGAFLLRWRKKGASVPRTQAGRRTSVADSPRKDDKRKTQNHTRETARRW